MAPSRCTAQHSGLGCCGWEETNKRAGIRINAACGWPGAALAFGSGVAEAVPLGVTVIVGVLVLQQGSF